MDPCDCASWWKLNHSFFDAPRSSCASLFFVTLLGCVAPESFLVESRAGQAFLRLSSAAAPTVTVVVEIAIAALLVAPRRSSRRRAGVALAILLHLMIAYTPPPFNVANYSVVCIVRFFFLLPDATAAAAAELSALRFSTTLTVAAVVLASGCVYLNPLGIVMAPVYVALAIFFLRALHLEAFSSPPPPPPPPVPSRRIWWRRVCIALHAESIVFCFILFVLGLADNGPSKPFANIRTSHGRSNHFFVPTGLIPRLLDSQPPSAWGGLGGGVYRVEDSNARVVNEIYPGELRLHSPRMLRLLKASNHSTRVFSPALARLVAPFLAVTNRPGKSFTKYTLPARELRRALAEAHGAGEPFFLEYSHLAAYDGDPGVGSGHAQAPTRVRVEQDARGGRSCAVWAKRSLFPRACSPEELGLLPPPPWWSLKLLLAWPYPVVQGELASQGGICFGE